MTDPPAGSAGAAAPATSNGRLWLAGLSALLATILALRLQLMLRLAFNWDEFHYLAFVHDLLRGTPLSWRQTFHVHLFPWLAAAAPDDEVGQLLIARTALFALGLATSLLLFLVGRRFLTNGGALFAVLSYHCLAEVIVHGASFRPDPMATFLAVAAAAAVVLRPASIIAAAVAGALLGLSLILTVKSVFVLPTLVILTLALAPPELDRRRRLGRPVVLLAAAVAIALVLWLYHRQAIVPVATDTQEAAALGRVGYGILWTGYWFPGRYYLLRSLQENALVWLLLAGGGVLAAAGLGRPGRSRAAGLALLALALPLTSVVVYRNSFPYFLAYVLAPASLLAGLALDRARRRWQRRGPVGGLLIAALVLGVFASGVANYLRQLPHVLAGQRQLLATVHRMFPEPVPYIDRCSMVATFPKVGFFMSTYGMEAYQRDERPVLAQAVAEHAPPLLVANTLPLNLLLPESQHARLAYRLLPEDRATLEQAYIHHWGILFVAGRSLELAAGPSEVAILIPGDYTLEAETALGIDGRSVEPGEVVRLSAGSHALEAHSAGRYTLRWGNNLYRPDEPPARLPIFVSL